MEFPPIKIDVHSHEWRELRAHINARIAYHREQLESPAVSIEKIPSIRARILELKSLVKANPQEKDHE